MKCLKNQYPLTPLFRQRSSFLKALITTSRGGLWKKQVDYKMRPRWQAFTGNKSMKPLYIRFNIARRAADILPYWIYIKFRYIFRMKACKYDALFERPLLRAGGKRNKYNSTETKFAEDMLFQAGEMKNPYIDKDSSAAHIHMPNSWNKTYFPQFQIMYSS